MEQAIQSTGNGHVKWKELDREGCAFGRLTCVRLEHVEKELTDTKSELSAKLDKTDAKLDKWMWTAVGLVVSVGTAAILLGLNLALGLL